MFLSLLLHSEPSGGPGHLVGACTCKEQKLLKWTTRRFTEFSESCTGLSAASPVLSWRSKLILGQTPSKRGVADPTDVYNNAQLKIPDSQVVFVEAEQ